MAKSHCSTNPNAKPSDSATTTDKPSTPSSNDAGAGASASVQTSPAPAKEIGGRPGLDPTRYGDWEKNGRCIDF